MIFSQRAIGSCVAPAVILALAGCGDKKQETPVAQKETAAGIAAQAGVAGDKPRPGRWQTQLRMLAFNMPGMSDDLRRTVGGQMGSAGDIIVCLTPEQAARSDGKFFQPHRRDCTYQKFSMANGQIAGKMVCANGGAKQTMEMRGSYSPESYDLTLTSRGDMNGAPMNMTMQVTGIRIGDCTGDERN